MEQDKSFFGQHDSLGHIIIRVGLVVLLALLLVQTGRVTVLAQTVDSGFNAATDGLVHAIAIQPHGLDASGKPLCKILIGGPFNTVNGVQRIGLARLNANGSLDTSFDPGSGVVGVVYSLALQPDGKVLIGGTFTMVGGKSRNRIARLNANGSLDTSFDPGSGVGVDGVVDEAVTSLAVQPDGKVLIGGMFTMVGGKSRNRIARLNANGSLDTSFDPGSGVAGVVFSLALQPDGKVLIGGLFDFVNGAARKSIARLHANGQLDHGFDTSVLMQQQYEGDGVYSLALQPDGKVLIGGRFLFDGMQKTRYIGRLNADGSMDDTFFQGLGPDGLVTSMAIQADGRILIAGFFQAVRGAQRFGIARLYADGTLDPTTFGIDKDPLVYPSMALQPDGMIVTNHCMSSGRICRFTNTSEAQQTLALSNDGTRILWYRRATSPELERVTFEMSLDGVSFTQLGKGEYFSNPSVLNPNIFLRGWKLEGLSLPAGKNIFLRARGFYSTGVLNGSVSMVDTVIRHQTPGLPLPGVLMLLLGDE